MVSKGSKFHTLRLDLKSQRPYCLWSRNRIPKADFFEIFIHGAAMPSEYVKDKSYCFLLASRFGSIVCFGDYSDFDVWLSETQ